MDAPVEEALALQRLIPDAILHVVARGDKLDRTAVGPAPG